MKVRCLLGVAVASCLLLAFEARAASSPEYSYSRSPSAVVLLIEKRSATTGFAESYSFFGDGRLEHHVSRPADHQPAHTSEARLTPAELDELVDMAVRYQIPQWDETRADSLRRRRNEGAVAEVQDAVSTSVTLALTMFRADDFEETNLKRRISVTALAMAAERYVDIPQFEGMRLLTAKAQRLLHEHRSSLP